MSTQHTARQARLNRRQMTAAYNERHAALLGGRNLEDELAAAEHKIARLESELAASQAALQATQAELIASEAARINAEADAIKHSKLAADRHVYMMQCFHKMQGVQVAHDKLSKVIRLALSPEQYHHYREMIDE